MPIAARKAAKIITVPPPSSGNSEPGANMTAIASSAPNAPVNADATQNRAASSFG